MKKILTTLLTLTLGLTPSLSTIKSMDNITQTNNQSKNNALNKSIKNMSNITQTNNQSKIIAFGESIKNDTNIKIEIENCLFFENGILKLNNKKATYINNYEVYKIITSEKYLQNMSALLKINNVNTLNLHNFSFNLIQNKQVTTYNDFGNVWTEYHWYWLYYWKLCFDSEACDSIIYLINLVLDAADFAVLLSTMYPNIGLAYVIFAFLCIEISIVFTIYNHGKGVWVFIAAIIPIEYGSN